MEVPARGRTAGRLDVELAEQLVELCGEVLRGRDCPRRQGAGKNEPAESDPAGRVNTRRPKLGKNRLRWLQQKESGVTTVML